MANKEINAPSADVVVVAAPVFAGRIPAFVADKISKLNGAGKKALTAVVYGVRAYDDALLELNDAMKNSGFDIIASAALVAQHSMVPEVGTGRPDQADISEIREFAERVLKAIESDESAGLNVPGNRPYREGMKVASTPISTPGCTACGYCTSICPTEAISVADKEVSTDINKCMLCMACVANCPVHARILPPPMQTGLTEKLGVFKDVRRANEFFL